MSPARQPSFDRQMHTRVPPRVQQIMAKKLERSVPGYMKQYVGPYMQQNVMHPEYTHQAMPASPMPETHVSPVLHESSGESWRQSHFQPTNSPQPTQDPPASQIPGKPAPTADPYTFITNPEIPKKQLALPGTGSMLTRLAYAVGGLLVLIIIFSVFKGLLSGTSSFASFVPVAQDQQEIIHLVTNASQQKGLSDSTQNFVATTQLSITSNQTQLLHYLSLNSYKIPTKNLGLKISLSLDNQLTAAVANTTYEQTFQSTMTSQLNSYINDLKQTYAKTTGKNGRALLNSDYNQAQLLLIQLQPAT